MSVAIGDALNISKIDAGYASNIGSQRVVGDAQVCIPWNGFDDVGRAVSASSYYTKQPGCNQAWDRISVENTIHRPQYTEYAALNLSGLLGVPQVANNYPAPGVALQSQAVENVRKVAGTPGYDFNTLRPGAGPSLMYSEGTVSAANRSADYSMQAYMQRKLNQSVGF